MTRAMIFDIDGTLADVRSIAHYYSPELEADWDHDSYHRDSIEAPVVEWVAEEARIAFRNGYYVIIVTSRKRRYVEQTVKFIYQNDIPYDLLLMREDNDITTSSDPQLRLIWRFSGRSSARKTSTNDLRSGLNHRRQE